MSTYTRTTKSNGTTEWAQGETITHTEHNDEWNTFLNDYNGGITNANISGSAAIANSKLVDIEASKVTDHADDDATYLTATSAGTTAVPSRPTTLEGELERLRYRIQVNNNHLFAQYMDSGGVAQSLGWVEPPPRGLNLIPSNSGFEVKTSATATDAPDGWTKEGTPTDLSIDATAANAFGTEKRSLNISGTTNDGVSIICKGLKSSTKYLIGIAYVRVAGTVTLTTENALGSGAYQNLNLSAASGTTATYLTGVVSSDSSGTDITVNIICGAAATQFRVYQVFMYEMSDRSSFEIPAIPTQTASVSTATSGMTGWTGTGNAWRTDTLTGLSLTAYVPMSGYRLIYEVQVPIRSTNNSDEGLMAYGAIQRNVDGGGASTVVGPVFFEGHAVSSNGTFGHTFVMRYVLDNPTPGSSYAMTFLLGAYDAADYADVIAYPSVNTVQMAGTSRLILERM